MSRRTVIGFVVTSAAILAALLLVPAVRSEVRARLGRATVATRVAEVQARVEPLWRERVSRAFDRDANGDVHAAERHAFPPASITILVLKQERELRVFANSKEASRELALFPVLAASGTLGPKLREGDRQVPEGVYPITFLNPNSRYRLSMRVGYPSEQDWLVAVAEGRDVSNLGGDIMIHGSDKSIGCVAIGDEAIEEVFWLVARVGIENTRVVLAPSRTPLALVDSKTPTWLRERYEELDRLMREMGM